MTFILDTDFDIKLTDEKSCKLNLTRIYNSKPERDWRDQWGNELKVSALHTIYIYEKKLKPSDEKHECKETSYTTYCNIGEQVVQFLNDEKYDVIYKTQNDFKKDGIQKQKTNVLGKAVSYYKEQVPDKVAYEKYKVKFEDQKKNPKYWNNLKIKDFILWHKFFYEGKPTRLLFDYKVKYTFEARADWKELIFPLWVFFSEKYYEKRLVKNRFNRDALIKYFQCHKDDQDANWRYLETITDNVMDIYDNKHMPGFRDVDAFNRLFECLNTYEVTFLKVDYNRQKMPEDMVSVFYSCFNAIQKLGLYNEKSNEEIRSTAVILIKIFVDFCIKTEQSAETFWKALFGVKSLFQQQNNAIVTKDFDIPDFNIFKDIEYWEKTVKTFPMTTKLWKKLDEKSPQIKFLKSFLENILKWKTNSSFGFKTFGPPKALLPPVDHTFKSLKF